MAREQMRPASKEQAPDPSNSYERSHPEHEAGMGRLDNNKATPTEKPDRIEDPVKNKQQGTRQLTGEDLTNQRGSEVPHAPDHSMHDEEPLGWDQAPTDIKEPRKKRHPRKKGKGGVE
jgi:hypothetical protein